MSENPFSDSAARSVSNSLFGQIMSARHQLVANERYGHDVAAKCHEELARVCRHVADEIVQFERRHIEFLEKHGIAPEASLRQRMDWWVEFSNRCFDLENSGLKQKVKQQLNEILASFELAVTGAHSQAEIRPPNFEEPRVNENADQTEKLESMQPAIRNAYLAFQFAERKAVRQLKDGDAYGRLKEDGLPDSLSDIDYSLPTFATWSRQLRSARRELGEQKYTSRSGRSTGKSVVREGDI